MAVCFSLPLPVQLYSTYRGAKVTSPLQGWLHREGKGVCVVLPILSICRRARNKLTLCLKSQAIISISTGKSIPLPLSASLLKILPVVLKDAASRQCGTQMSKRHIFGSSKMTRYSCSTLLECGSMQMGISQFLLQQPRAEGPGTHHALPTSLAFLSGELVQNQFPGRHLCLLPAEGVF